MMRVPSHLVHPMAMMWIFIFLNGLQMTGGFLPQRKSFPLQRSESQPMPSLGSLPRTRTRPGLNATVEKEREMAAADGAKRESGSGGVPGDNKSEGDGKKRETTMHKLYTLPRTAYRIYTSYAKQLWTDTNTSARTKIANDKVRTAIRETQNILTSEYAEYSDVSNEARKRLLVACNEMLACLPRDPDDDKMSVMAEIEGNEVANKVVSQSIIGAAKNRQATGTDITSSTAKDSFEAVVDDVPVMPQPKFEGCSDLDLPSTAVALAADSVAPKDADALALKKKPRSILFGAIMGAVVACWVFSGDYIFTGIFCLITILGQLEYYRMVMNTGVFPARRISVVGATSMFVTVRIKRV